ncbi:MAG: hypothetical protein ABJI42_12095 [Henriciella sp.]
MEKLQFNDRIEQVEPPPSGLLALVLGAFSGALMVGMIWLASAFLF